MAYTFPLSLADFWQILPIRDLSFSLSENVEISGESGGGEVETNTRGTRLWQGEVILDDMQPAEAAEVMAMLDIVRRNGASFMAFDTARPGPRADISGGALGGATPLLHSVIANNRDIRLSGLPPAYHLQRHDYVAFAYGADPVRFALHRVAQPVIANSAGLTPLFEVSPNLRPGWATGTVVSVLRAPCKCRIVPGSFQEGRRKATMTTGVSFRFTQTLR